MKLKEVIVSNFRCYREPMRLTLDDLTVLVGRNDAGKSTLLDALDTFFNEKSLDKNDAAKGGEPKEVTVSCIFECLPDELLLDETVSTSLAKEYLLNLNGDLEITKTYNCSIEKPKVTTIKVKVSHPNANGYGDLLILKIDELKKRAQDIGVDLEGVNKTVKRDIREAIRHHAEDLEVIEKDLVLVGEGVDEKSNAIKIWEGLKQALPLYALFKSDRNSSDQDIEAQDPLKTAVKEAIALKAAEFQAVMDFVEAEVKKVAILTLAKLNEMDPTIAATLDPKFERPNWASLIKASITGDDDIPLNKRGSGVRRLILLNFFRAKAEKAMLEKKAQSTIFAVEEPETSQHPHNQKMLVRALQQLAVGEDQVIITTHTPMLGRVFPSTSLRFLNKEADSSRTLKSGGTDEVNKSIADSLGVLPDHTVRLFIVVEGIHDITFMKSLSRMLNANGRTVPNLEGLEASGELVFVPASGANNLAFWTSRLSVLNRPEFHLYDRDAPAEEEPKYQQKIDEVNLRDGCKAFSTTRLEMENFIHHQAINTAAQSLGLAVNLTTPFGPNDDVPALLSAELNIHAPHHSRWNENRVKGWLAGNVLPVMTLEMLAEIDPNEEMIGWMHAIEEMLA